MNSSSSPYPGIVLLRPSVTPPPGWDIPNMYLVGDDGLTLIDAGFLGDPTISMILDAVGDRNLERILVTHGHRDHIGSAAALREAKGCEILCHELDFPLVEGRYGGLAPDGAIREHDRFRAGDFTIEVIETPGHSPGHVCFWIEKEGILLSGDLVVGSGTSLVGPPDGNMKKYMESLERVKGLNHSLILPGHGPVVKDTAAKMKELIEHRQLREINIAKVLSTGPKSLTEMLNAMYLGLIHPGLHGAAICTILGHLEKLIEEEKVDFEPRDAPAEKRRYRLAVKEPLPF